MEKGEHFIAQMFFAAASRFFAKFGTMWDKGELLMNNAPGVIHVLTSEGTHQIVLRLTMYDNPNTPDTRYTLKRHQMIKIFISHIAIFVFFLLFSLSPAQARGAYKWVDESGNTVYSQTPPPKGKSKRISIQPTANQESAEAARKKLQDQLNKMDGLKQQGDHAKQKDNVPALSPTELEKKCNAVRDNISLLSNYARRISLKMEDGSKKTLPQDEREKQLEIYKEFFNKNCTK